MKYKFETWHIIVGLILIVLIGQSTGMFSILGTAEGYKSIEPTSLSIIEKDMDEEFINKIKKEQFDGLIISYSTASINQLSAPYPTKAHMFGVLDFKLARLFDYMDISQEDIDDINIRAEEEFGIDPGFTIEDFNNLKSGECKPVIELYKKFVPLLLSEPDGIDGVFGSNIEISHAGLIEEIKGRDIYDLNILITHKIDSREGYPTVTQRAIGRVWCNQNNEMVNFELEANNDNSPFDDWYFDTYIVVDEDAKFDWYSWAPNIGTLDQKQSAFIIFGVGFLILYLLFKRK